MMEPMDFAFRLLKRQTTLGEFHPDMPSPYGDWVPWFHGTNVENMKVRGRN